MWVCWQITLIGARVTGDSIPRVPLRSTLGYMLSPASQAGVDAVMNSDALQVDAGAVINS